MYCEKNVCVRMYVIERVCVCMCVCTVCILACVCMHKRGVVEREREQASHTSLFMHIIFIDVTG